MIVVAGACVLATLLSLARVAPRYRRLYPTAEILALLLGALIVLGIWDTAHPRLIGVVAVLLAAATLALPVLERWAQARRGAGARAVEGLWRWVLCGPGQDVSPGGAGRAPRRAACRRPSRTARRRRRRDHAPRPCPPIA